MHNNTIVYIGGFILPDKNAAAHRVVTIGKLLKSLGYNLVYIGIQKKKNENLSILETERNLDGYKSFHCYYPSGILEWGRHLTSIRDLKKVLFHIGVNKVSAIIAYNYPAIALARIISLGKKNNLKVISDCTEWAIDDKSSGIRSILRNIDTNWRMKKIHFQLDGMIVISKFLLEYYYKRINDIIEIPPLVDKREEKWTGANSFKKENQINLVYAGSPGNGAKDRIDLIVSAFHRLSEMENFRLRLEIVGISEDQFNDEFNTSKTKRGNSDRIVFKGRVSHNEAINLTQNAHFSIFLRDVNQINSAGFPTKFVESLSCGTPVLTNRTSNIQDYLIQGKNGFFLDYDSIEALDNSLKKINGMGYDEIFTMKEFCTNDERFDFRNYTQSLGQFFKKVIEN